MSTLSGRNKKEFEDGNTTTRPWKLSLLCRNGTALEFGGTRRERVNVARNCWVEGEVGNVPETQLGTLQRIVHMNVERHFAPVRGDQQNGRDGLFQRETHELARQSFPARLQ